MMKKYEEFRRLLESEDKEMAMKYILGILENETLSIVSVYADIMTPALNNITCKLDNREICIWQEHVRTGIVRSIVECCYPFMLKEKAKKNLENKGNAVVLCPPEEYHDLGARMATDFFELSGYETTFVGGNTPIDDILVAIRVVKPKVVAISVSNYYNLISTKKMIEKLRKQGNKNYIIAVGGNAFYKNPDAYKEINADCCIESFEDIGTICERGVIL